MDVECALLERVPSFTWCARDKDGNWRAMLCFRARLDRLDIRVSDECEEYGFFAKESLESLDLYPQTRPLQEWL